MCFKPEVQWPGLCGLYFCGKHIKVSMITVVEFKAKQATDSRQILDKLFFHQTYFEQTKDGDFFFVFMIIFLCQKSAATFIYDISFYSYL